MLRWSSLYPPPGSDGASRVHHTLASFGSRVVPVGGGLGKSSHRTEAAAPSHVLDLHTFDWEEIPTALPKSVLPRLSGASAITVGTLTYVFGGETLETLDTTDSMSCIEDRGGSYLVTDVLPTEGSARPSPRKYHSACTAMLTREVPPEPTEGDGDEAADTVGDSKESESPDTEQQPVETVTEPVMWVFGGSDASGRPLGDVWQFNPFTLSWTQLEVSGDVPSPRMHATASYCPSTSTILVFGGFDGTSRLNDSYSFDITTNTFTKLDCSGEIPTPRAMHASTTATIPVYATANRSEDNLTGCREYVVIIGGRSDTGLSDSAVHLLDVSCNSWTRLLTAKGVPQMFGHTVTTAKEDVTPPVDPVTPYLPTPAATLGETGKSSGSAIGESPAEGDGAPVPDSDSKAAEGAPEEGGEGKEGDADADADGDADTEEAKLAEAPKPPTGPQTSDVLIILGGSNGKATEPTAFKLTLDACLAWRGAEAKEGELGWGDWERASGDHYEGRMKKNLRNGIGTCAYADGGRYEGEWLNDLRHGRGRMQFPNGDVYEGDWVDDKMHGDGEMTFGDSPPNGEASFVGSFLHGKRDGVGTMTYVDGGVYSGGWKEDLKHGEGTQDYADGGRYEGPWVNDMREGELGYYKSPAGDEYSGQWYRDQEHGSGSCQFYDMACYRGTYNKGRRNGVGVHRAANGDLYQGKFANGVRMGKGVCQYAGGHTYVGLWKDGVRDGKGEMKMKDGSVYHGMWKGDVKCGRGRMEFADGSVYEGNWAGDKQSGQGVRTYPEDNDAIKYEGSWLRGVRHGEGHCDFRDGSVYDGLWASDQRSGRGVHVYANGDRYEGNWRDDLRHGLGKFTRAAPEPNCGLAPGLQEYDGEWSSDTMSGRGTSTYTNDDAYDGEWRNNVREGSGTCTSLAGHRYEGMYEADLKEGYGVAISAEGDRYAGEWKRNRMHVRRSNWKGIPTFFDVTLDRTGVSAKFLDEMKDIAAESAEADA